MQTPSLNTGLWVLEGHMFYERGAMSFSEKNIPDEVLNDILRAATSCAWPGKWKLISVQEKENRVRVIEAMQKGMNDDLNEPKHAAFLERWKTSPLFVVFCIPKSAGSFLFVPEDKVRVYAIKEVGTAVRSLELVASAHGISLHGIMGALVDPVSDRIRRVLHIPSDYEIVYFGVMGYPKEEVDVKFPDLRTICYSESWANN
ncbi:MAG: nitroreductase family protein [archaeon]|nr:nitroreductase family protein [archaeon]